MFADSSPDRRPRTRRAARLGINGDLADSSNVASNSSRVTRQTVSNDHVSVLERARSPRKRGATEQPQEKFFAQPIGADSTDNGTSNYETSSSINEDSDGRSPGLNEDRGRSYSGYSGLKSPNRIQVPRKPLTQSDLPVSSPPHTFTSMHSHKTNIPSESSLDMNYSSMEARYETQAAASEKTMLTPKLRRYLEGQHGISDQREVSSEQLPISEKSTVGVGLERQSAQSNDHFIPVNSHTNSRTKVDASLHKDTVPQQATIRESAVGVLPGREVKGATEIREGINEMRELAASRSIEPHEESEFSDDESESENEKPVGSFREQNGTPLKRNNDVTEVGCQQQERSARKVGGLEPKDSLPEPETDNSNHGFIYWIMFILFTLWRYITDQTVIVIENLRKVNWPMILRAVLFCILATVIGSTVFSITDDANSTALSPSSLSALVGRLFSRQNGNPVSNDFPIPENFDELTDRLMFLETRLSQFEHDLETLSISTGNFQTYQTEQNEMIVKNYEVVLISMQKLQSDLSAIDKKHASHFSELQEQFLMSFVKVNKDLQSFRELLTETVNNSSITLEEQKVAAENMFDALSSRIDGLENVIQNLNTEFDESKLKSMIVMELDDKLPQYIALEGIANTSVSLEDPEKIPQAFWNYLNIMLDGKIQKTSRSLFDSIQAVETSMKRGVANISQINDRINSIETVLKDHQKNISDTQKLVRVELENKEPHYDNVAFTWETFIRDNHQRLSEFVLSQIEEQTAHNSSPESVHQLPEDSIISKAEFLDLLSEKMSKISTDLHIQLITLRKDYNGYVSNLIAEARSELAKEVKGNIVSARNELQGDLHNLVESKLFQASDMIPELMVNDGLNILINSLVKKAVDEKLSFLKQTEINHASVQSGATVISELTSQTFSPYNHISFPLRIAYNGVRKLCRMLQKESGSDLTPISVLDDTSHDIVRGETSLKSALGWISENPAQLAVHLPYAIEPRSVVIENNIFTDPLMNKAIPKRVSVWIRTSREFIDAIESMDLISDEQRTQINEIGVPDFVLVVVQDLQFNLPDNNVDETTGPKEEKAISFNSYRNLIELPLALRKLPLNVQDIIIRIEENHGAVYSSFYKLSIYGSLSDPQEVPDAAASLPTAISEHETSEQMVEYDTSRDFDALLDETEDDAVLGMDHIL